MKRFGQPLRPHLVCAATLLLSIACAHATADSGWPTFRGPTRDGVAAANSKPPVSWSPTENVAWRAELPGEGWSTPVVGRGRIYLTGAIDKTPDKKKGKVFRLVLFVIDAASGELLHEHHVFDEKGGESPHKIHSKNTHASSTAVLDGERLFVHFGYQGTACLDLKGKILWSNRDHYYKPVHGNGSTPILVGDRLIFTCDGAKDPKIVALDANTGKLAWEVPRNVDTKKKFAFCTPALINVGGQQQVVSPAADIVMALAPKTGNVLWSLSYIGYSVVPKPIYHQNKVILSTSFDSPSILAIDPTGKGDVTDTHLTWEVTKNAPHTPSMIASNGLIYCVSDRGVAMCVDAETGEEIYKQRVGGNFSASPVLAAGKIYYTSEAGKTTVIRVGREYEIVAENDLDERTLASPAIVGNAMYLRTADALYKIEE